MLDDGFGVQGGAEIEPALRHAADDAGLGRQREIFQNPLLRGHGRDALGHADAEIDDAARRQLESAAPGNHLALVEVQRLNAVERHALAAGIRVIIGGGVGLEVVSRPGDDHAIHQNTGDLHLARVERLGGGDALDLRDDEAPRILGRHGGGEIVEGQRLAFHGDVARRIGRGAADQRHVDGEGLVEKPFLAAQVDQLDQILDRDRVELAATLPRIDEGAQADLAQGAGPVRGDLAVEVGDASKRQVVGLDGVVERKLGDLRNEGPMAADNTLEQGLVGEPVEATLLAVPRSGGKHQGQVLRLAPVQEGAFKRDEKLFGSADAHEPGNADRIPVADDRHGF